MIREAEERLKLSSMISSSIRFSLTGSQVGWTMKTSEPRTFSSIWQNVSPSEKLNAETLPASRFRYSQISVHQRRVRASAEDFQFTSHSLPPERRSTAERADP